MIFCKGMPGLPGNKRAMMAMHKNNYWSFFPRYRGTWESSGTFLKDEPTKDILDVIDGIHKSFISLWDGAEYKIEKPEIYIVGSSFGGPAAMLVSKDPRVKKIICVSPVVDWTQESRDEPIDWLGETVQKSFGQGYRYDMADWKKLSEGTFYNPVAQKDRIDGKKVMIIHALDDEVVLPEPVKQFAKDIGSATLFLKEGGHLSTRSLMKWRIMRKIKQFLKG